MSHEPALSSYRGEAFTQPGIHYELDGETRKDITGWTLLFTMKTFGDQPVVLSKAAVVTDGPEGEYEFSLTSEEADLEPRVYTCDVTRTDGGQETMVAHFYWTIMPTIGAL